MNNASSNINTTKEFVNKRNTQMTSQKKIDRPSDDPVIAVRSLRLSTTLAQVTQYHEKNIPDASQWISVTETALINMRNIGNDCKQIAVAGSSDPKNTQDDRKTMLKQLQELQKQLFAEGNADYANRTVFTGYRTNCNLTFTEDELNTNYRITQNLTIKDNMEDHRYYSGNVDIPSTEEELLAPSVDPENSAISDIAQTNYYRIRLNYDDINTIDSIKIGSIIDHTFPVTDDVYDDSQGVQVIHTVGSEQSTYVFYAFANESDWASSELQNVKGTATEQGVDTIKGLKCVGENSIVFIKETGDLIMGNKIASTLKNEDATINITYDRNGFKEGELRPEYYYNCVKTADPLDVHVPVTYTKYNEAGERIHFDIEYTIAASQTVAINTEAADVFDSSIYRDVTEMIDACQRAISAFDKVKTLEDMASESQYASDEDQEWLKIWKDAAQKEFDFYNDNMQKLFNTEIGKIDAYYGKMNLAIADLGCKKDSLDLTKTRVGDQQQTVQSLQSLNDDIDLSKIIIDYTAAYTAYQASLTAAGKLGESTLLNYI